MKHSESRILTTHTGSLPRPEQLVEMLGAVSRGERVDEAAAMEWLKHDNRTNEFCLPIA